jgi:hypothetical protein
VVPGGWPWCVVLVCGPGVWSWCAVLARRQRVSDAALRSAEAFRSTMAMMANDGTKNANAASEGSHQPPMSKRSPIASEKDMPRIEPILATRT